MTQKEFFTHLVERIVQLSIDLERERGLRHTAEKAITNINPSVDPRYVNDMLNYMVTDRKIEAIKMHRTLTGFGLKESKDAIETVMNRFGRAAT